MYSVYLGISEHLFLTTIFFLFIHFIFIWYTFDLIFLIGRKETRSHSFVVLGVVFMCCSFYDPASEVAIWGVPCVVSWVGWCFHCHGLGSVSGLGSEPTSQLMQPKKKKRSCNLEAGQQLLEFWILIALGGGHALKLRTTLIFSLFPLYNLLGFWLHLSLNPCVDMIWAVCAGIEDKTRCQLQSGHFLRMPGNLDQTHGVRDELKYDWL